MTVCCSVPSVLLPSVYQSMTLLHALKSLITHYLPQVTDRERVTSTNKAPETHTDNSFLTIKCKQKCLFSFGQFCELALPEGKKQVFSRSEEKYKYNPSCTLKS